MNFTLFPRADSVQLVNDHDIYRVWEIPGRRDSDYYDGSGIEKTYNMAAVDDQEFPDDENACPSLNKMRVGNVDKNVMRKKVEHNTSTCEECGIEARKNPRSGETFCPECGLIMEAAEETLVRNANTTERYPEEADE